MRIWIMTVSVGLERTEQFKSNSVHWPDRIVALTFLIRAVWLTKSVLWCVMACRMHLKVDHLAIDGHSQCHCIKCYWLDTEVMNSPICIMQPLTTVPIYIIYLLGLFHFWCVISQWPCNNLHRMVLGTYRQCGLTDEEIKVQENQLFNWLPPHAAPVTHNQILSYDLAGLLLL